MTAGKPPVNLIRYLDTPEFEDSLDYMGLHGFLTGSIIIRNEFNAEYALGNILDQQPIWKNDKEKQTILDEFEELYKTLNKRFLLNEDITLPCSFYWEDGIDDSDLEHWATGFIEATLSENSSLLSETNEDGAYEILIPFLIVSGLFDNEDNDLSSLRENEKFMNDLIEDIPQLLIDFYLYLRRE